MKNKNELEYLGTKISKDYIENNTDLTENLEKQANIHMLNKQQVKRVAEVANVETYLKLAEVAKDGYVEFDLADVEKINSANNVKQAKTDQLEDLLFYNQDEILNKSAELLHIDDNVKFDNSVINFTKVAEDLLNIKTLDNKLSDKFTDLQNQYNDVIYQVKQASASGNDISTIKEVIKKALHNNTDNTEYMLDSINKDLSDKLPTQDFTKEASLTEDELDMISTDSPLYKSVEEYEKIANDLSDTLLETIKAKIDFMDDVKDTEYKYYIKEASQNKILNTIAKLNPFKTKLRTAITTGALVLPFGINVGEKQEKFKQQFKDHQRNTRRLKDNG